MRIVLRYGTQGLPVDLPEAHVAHVLRLNRMPVIADAQAATREALAHPIGAAPLQEGARGRASACVVVSDLTRPVPNAVLLPPVLDALQAAGMAAADITVLVATGLHRANTPAELEAMGLGEALARGVRVESHVARDRDSHVHLGTSSLGIPVWVDRRYVAAEVRVLTGLVEPHLMAGYSGGRKAVCPGLCAAETIMQWHSPHMLAPPEVCAGNLRSNQVHAQAVEIAQLAGGEPFIVNVTLDEQRQITGVFAGDLRAAHLAAMEQAERQTKVPIPTPVDIVLTSSAGYPLDLTFYQGIKGMVAALPIVKAGGTIIIAQENSEGVGGPEFSELLFSTADPHARMCQALAGAACGIDHWQFQELEKVLQHCEVLNYSTGIDAATQARLFVQPVAGVEQAVAQALARHGDQARIAVIPEGPYVLACLADDPVGSATVREMIAG